MASSSRTQQRSAGRGASFGRTAGNRSSSGRSLRAGKGEAGAKGRFGLGGALGPSGYGRHGSRAKGRSKAKPAQSSGLGRALGTLGGVLPRRAASKAPRRSTGPAGLALLAGAAGLALKNRGKLTGLIGRGDSRAEAAPGATVSDNDVATALEPGTTSGLAAGGGAQSTPPAEDSQGPIDLTESHEPANGSEPPRTD